MAMITLLAFFLLARFAVNLAQPIDTVSNGVFRNKNSVGEVSSTAGRNLTDEPIKINIDYDQSNSLSASWSQATSWQPEEKEYELLDYTDYATLFDKFIKRYPTIIIYTTGYASSKSTFGEIGQDQFGELVFSTEKFKIIGTHYEYIVDENDTAFGYSVRAQIGLGFKMEGTKLYIKPVMYGYILSHGAYYRGLDLSFTISKVTFSTTTNSLTDRIFTDNWEE